MKKILIMSLLGLLSWSIQSNVIAEDVIQTTDKDDQADISTAQDDTTKIDNRVNTVDSSENKVNSLEGDTNTSGTENAISVEGEGSSEVKVAETPKMEILGKSVNIYSLRGYNSIESESEIFPNRRNMVVDGGISVTFGDQPPMIPHSIDKDRISLQENTCLKCHSKTASKLEMGPKPTSSHFRDREGKQQKSLAKNRYFCTQCHTPQAHTQPLVKNNFTN